MTILAKCVLFLFGMGLCVQLIAAGYGFIDLRYTIRTAYAGVLRRMLLWSLAALVVYQLLPDFLRPSFLWGMIAYGFLYVLIYRLYQLLFKRNTRASQ
jgi:hypothetical protein